MAMDDQDTNPQSQSPSGAEPHNSYGLVPQQGKQQQKSPSEASEAESGPQSQSQSPSGAEPHDSYGLAEGKGGKESKGSKGKAIADDPTYNQPAPSGGQGSGGKGSPADSRSKL